MLNYSAKNEWKKEFTVWFSITFMKTFFAELLATLSAEEMLSVPSLIQSSYTFVKNGTVAISTTWAKQIMIIWFTYLRYQNEMWKIKFSINTIDDSCNAKITGHSQYGWPSRSKKLRVPSSWEQWVHVKCSGCQVRPKAVITWPTIGLSHALQQPFCVVVTPWRFMFSCKFPAKLNEIKLLIEVEEKFEKKFKPT